MVYAFLKVSFHSKEMALLSNTCLEFNYEIGELKRITFIQKKLENEPKMQSTILHTLLVIDCKNKKKLLQDFLNIL